MIKNTLVRPILGTLLILLVPLALQITVGTGVDGQGFNWTIYDFIIIGILIFCTGVLIELALRKLGRYKIIGVIGAIILFLLLWVELAVGLFTNWGS